jgi:prepilin-type N-terminal cleavage/methylation domain-containing protein
MNSQRAGFSLVELLIVAVLGGILMGAVYQSLIVQEQTYRTTGEIVRGQDAMRMALGVIEAELREVATNPALVTTPAGADVMGIGASDLIHATRDYVVIRAQRKLGFVCSIETFTKHVITWSLGDLDLFETEEPLLVFADGDVTRSDDDHWIAARVDGDPQPSTASCPARPGNPVAHQRLNLKALSGADLPEAVLANVRVGSPIRAVQRVTYGLYPSAEGWYLGRRRGEDDAVERLVEGLAGPGEGLVFTYLDAQGNTLSDPVSVTDVAAVSVAARTGPPQGSGAKPVSLTTHIYFRNN